VFFGFLVPAVGLVVLPRRVRRGPGPEARTQARLLFGTLVGGFAVATVLAVVTLLLWVLQDAPGLAMVDPTAHGAHGAPTALLFTEPRHPYTRALIDSIPRMTETSVNDGFEVDGEPPSPYDVPAGCRFHPRCPLASEICRENDPPLLAVGPAHESACLKADELALIPVPNVPLEQR